MLFNSLEFALFLPLVFFLYWFVAYEKINLQNIIIVSASYLFYGWWDWRFLSLILFSTVLDYCIGLLLGKTDVVRKRKILLLLSIVVNIGFLAVFKYFNFFIDNFSKAFALFGYHIPEYSLQIVLPVGISFYTFQTLSYSIDVYRRQLQPTSDFIAFAAFVSFFPQLVAGPIERATHLLPQFHRERVFSYDKAIDGLRQIVWGLFKKIVIADNCAYYANLIFNDSASYSGSALILGVFFFTFQIYGDFSGYSDIAIGVAKLFDFSLMKNFACPYFSRDIAEFWRRWHISLSTWFRDYVYIPLGGSRGRLSKKIRNVFVIFILSGFWHGANWTFIVWGLLNTLFFIPLYVTNNNRNYLSDINTGKIFPPFRDLLQMIATFTLVAFAWIFFRAESLSHAFAIINEIFSLSLFSIPEFKRQFNALICILLIAAMLIIEWRARKHSHVLENVANTSMKRQVFVICSFILLIFVFGKTGTELEFIYFQF